MCTLTWHGRNERLEQLLVSPRVLLEHWHSGLVAGSPFVLHHSRKRLETINNRRERRKSLRNRTNGGGANGIFTLLQRPLLPPVTTRRSTTLTYRNEIAEEGRANKRNQTSEVAECLGGKGGGYVQKKKIIRNHDEESQTSR